MVDDGRQCVIAAAAAAAAVGVTSVISDQSLCVGSRTKQVDSCLLSVLVLQS